jgi:hypothetical protein
MIRANPTANMMTAANMTHPVRLAYDVDIVPPSSGRL